MSVLRTYTTKISKGIPVHVSREEKGKRGGGGGARDHVPHLT